MARKMGFVYKFSANISSLFMDIPDHIESYQEILNRKEYRFPAVEAQDPYKNSLEDWKNALDKAGDSKPEFVLINSVNLLMKYGLRMPTDEEFETELNKLGEYCTILNVRKVHLLLTDAQDQNQMERVKHLLVKGAQFLNKLNVTCLIEPLSIRPTYYLTSYDTALKLVEELKEPNLKIMFDTFHCQRLHGNLCHYMELLKDHIGHVQISQVPLRDNPMDEGELNHDFLLKKLAEVYDDYIGLEYFNHATDSFDWVKKYVQPPTTSI